MIWSFGKAGSSLAVTVADEFCTVVVFVWKEIRRKLSIAHDCALYNFLPKKLMVLPSVQTKGCETKQTKVHWAIKIAEKHF